MRTTAVVLLAGFSLAVAKPVNFTVFAAAPNTEFWDIPINAVDGEFQIFKHVNQICPEPQKTHCTTSSHTIIRGDDKNGTLSLGSIVPGGQDIYLTKEGLLGFVRIGERGIPEGAIRNPTGFKYEKPITRYSDLGKLKYAGGNFSLCGPADPIYPTYSLFIETGKNKLPSDSCTPIEIGARYNSAKEQVWAYN